MSPAGLAMRGVRCCLLDEVDRYPASASSEGDPVYLAATRTANLWNGRRDLDVGSRLQAWCCFLAATF